MIYIKINDGSAWSTLLLNFTYRIETIKMYILPRPFYVKVPHTQFQDWANYFFSFYLEWKKPRIKYSTLTISKGGGMALPNLRDYYLAAQLTTVWCDDGYEAKWKGK